MSDPKRSKALRTILSLQTLADHPNTPPHEAEAARGRIKALREKHGIEDTPPKPPPRSNPRPPQDRTGGFNSTSRQRHASWEGGWFSADETEAERQARKIRDQEREYQAWKAMNDAMVREEQRKKANAEADRKYQAQRDRERAEARERERKRREEAQRKWQERHRHTDSMGRPMTPEDLEEARRDPLGWAAKQDKRSASEKNDDMQYQYTHGWERKDPPKRSGPKCSKPETFYDPGGEPRKRNDYPMDCYKCGSQLLKGQGALFKVGTQWHAVCCETVPGPRKKKPGRG